MASFLYKQDLTQSSIKEGVLMIIQKYFFLFLKENICCDLSLELSQQDGSNDRSQNTFLRRNMANDHLIIPVTSSYLEHC